nr:snRNA-activating protein complex subunit 2-like [Labrus bergylta]
MKPPPRKCSKPELSTPPVPVKWQRPEHMKLLSGLKRQSRTIMGAGDLDRRGIRCVTLSLSVCQMLVVSSTEPLTLRNCDPPNIQRQTSNQSRPVGRTVPPRLIFRPTPLAAPLLVLKTPAPTMGPARRLPAPSKVLLVPLLQGEPSTKTGASAAPSCQTATTASPQPATPPSPRLPRSLISALATKPTPPPPSSPAAALPAGLGRSCMLKEDSPRIIGVKCVVDFEQIYRYLSVILKPDKECHLTPMEGAIMLDLLMSLPEELPQLDCKELQKHLKQVYQSLSSSADSMTAGDVLKDLQGQLSTPTESPAAPERDESDAQQNLTDAHSDGVAPQPHDAESQSSEISNTTSQQDADITGVCPPLNPFMVPVKLKVQKSSTSNCVSVKDSLFKKKFFIISDQNKRTKHWSDSSWSSLLILLPLQCK